MLEKFDTTNITQTLGGATWSTPKPEEIRDQLREVCERMRRECGREDGIDCVVITRDALQEMEAKGLFSRAHATGNPQAMDPLTMYGYPLQIAESRTEATAILFSMANDGKRVLLIELNNDGNLIGTQLRRPKSSIEYDYGVRSLRDSARRLFQAGAMPRAFIPTTS